MAREKRLISLKEASAYLGIHPSSMYRLLKRGKIQAIKIGSDWQFEYTKLDEWIDAQPAGKVWPEHHEPRKKDPSQDSD